MVTARQIPALITCQLCLLSCTGEDSATTFGIAERCQQLASKNQVDQACAIDFARSEILRREGEVTIADFEVHFDKESGQWVVMAIHNPALPGGHIFVAVGLDGIVSDYETGL